jgi:hypothetical protein
MGLESSDFSAFYSTAEGAATWTAENNDPSPVPPP